jgi:hypothetical protein|tara:strand:+ start:1234 stop:1392 length:159 start_codon:yes stop_codon:yes gene_type:complete
MTEIQLARLTTDIAELKEYIKLVASKGNNHLVSKLEKKLSYLQSRIAERMTA